MKEPDQRSLIRAEAQLMFSDLPSVFYIYCDETKGKSKYKYLVFLSKDDDLAYFFMINSKQYFYEGEIQVTPNDLPCLIRDSWIDCRELFEISKEELIKRVADNIDSYNRGKVSVSVQSKIANAVCTSRTLSPIEKRKILSWLTTE